MAGKFDSKDRHGKEREPNLGQKEAQQEKKSEAELSHMGELTRKASSKSRESEKHGQRK
jgi:hypothetical protein